MIAAEREAMLAAYRYRDLIGGLEGGALAQRVALGSYGPPGAVDAVAAVERARARITELECGAAIPTFEERVAAQRREILAIDERSATERLIERALGYPSGDPEKGRAEELLPPPERREQPPTSGYLAAGFRSARTIRSRRPGRSRAARSRPWSARARPPPRPGPPATRRRAPGAGRPAWPAPRVASRLRASTRPARPPPG
jgi:hypothetical protein